MSKPVVNTGLLGWKTVVRGVTHPLRSIRRIFKIRDARVRISKKCDATKLNVNVKFRDTFKNEFVYSRERITEGSHSHARGASDRRLAELSIKTFILGAGYTPYSVSTSSRDVVNGTEGQRLYYSPKDLDQPVANFKVNDQHVLYMIDVDYYADMDYWLLKGRPILVYTMVPTMVGGPCVDGSFYIEKNHLCVTYNGGACYKHRVWDYNLDHFTVKGKGRYEDWSLMVKVDQVVSPSDPMRRIVLLTPTTWYLSKYDSKLFSSTPKLERMEFSVNGVNLLVHQARVDDKTTTMLSASWEASPIAFECKYHMFMTICQRMVADPHATAVLAERFLIAEKVKDAHTLAAIIFDGYKTGWYLTKFGSMRRVTYAGVARTAPHYQCTSPCVNDVGVDIGVEVGKPVLIGANVFPRQSYNNDCQAIAGRVVAVRNEVWPQLDFIHKAAESFITGFPKGVCVPESVSTVIDKQTRPLQRARNTANLHWFREKFKIKSFMKKESYGKVTDPRNISTVPPAHTVRLSCFTYAMKHVLEKYDWYCPSKSPTEIADALRAFTIDVDKVSETDYSKLDGTISKFLRTVIERGVLLRLFPPEYHEELIQLIDDEFAAKATTATGLKYEPGYSRLSGSPVTTIMNTIVCAFIVYVAALRAKLIKAGDIKKIPALLYGDDGINKYIKPAALIKAAEQCGLTLKINHVGFGPVNFLARTFVNPWLTTTSVQDPKRCLGKIHVSTIRDVPPEVVAVYKATGYIASDPFTPVISNYCRYVIRQNPAICNKTLERYNLAREQNWFLENFTDSWPQSTIDIDLMRTVVANSLEIDESAVVKLSADIDTGRWEPIRYHLPITVEAVLAHGDGTTQLVRPPTALSV